jgi:hypothetical protein
VNRCYRHKIAALGADIVPAHTVLLKGDASPFIRGDVLEPASGERIELTESTELWTNTVLVRRAVRWMVPSTGPVNDTVRLIADGENGAATRTLDVGQDCQTRQQAVQPGTSLQASTDPRPPFESPKVDAPQT